MNAPYCPNGHGRMQWYRRDDIDGKTTDSFWCTKCDEEKEVVINERKTEG